MTDLETRCLDTFPNWLSSLADDAQAYATILEAGGQPEPVERAVAGALNYLFKSLDLIPDGIEDLGFIDDSFVLRASAARALAAGDGTSNQEALTRLASEVELVNEFLGEAAPRLERFVAELGTSSVRGRSVDDVLSKPELRSELVSDVRAWADSYDAPSFARDEKNLVKLRAFMTTKLPGA